MYDVDPHWFLISLDGIGYIGYTGFKHQDDGSKLWNSQFDIYVLHSIFDIDIRYLKISSYILFLHLTLGGVTWTRGPDILSKKPFVKLAVS